jgi:hypothetical protein
MAAQNNALFVEELCSTLREPLIQLVGAAGTLALFQRGLVLAARNTQLPLLTQVRVEADNKSGFTSVESLRAHFDEGEVAEGMCCVLAQVLGLLTTFIGADLAMRLTRRAWPGLSIDAEREDADEKDKR